MADRRTQREIRRDIEAYQDELNAPAAYRYLDTGCYGRRPGGVDYATDDRLLRQLGLFLEMGYKIAELTVVSLLGDRGEHMLPLSMAQRAA